MPASRKVLYAVSGTVLLLVVLLSPFIAFWVSHYGLDWNELNNVGGSYGAVSAVLNGAALIGVVITVALQRRQTQLATEQAARQLHMDLMQSLWDDPVLMRALEDIPEGHEELAKQATFLNMYFMYLRMTWRADQTSLAEITDLATRHFSTEAGTYFWESVRSHMRKHYEPNFVAALDKAYAVSRDEPDTLFKDWRRPKTQPDQPDSSTATGTP